MFSPFLLANFCWRMRFDLIFCVKIFKFEKKEKPLVAHSFIFTRKQASKKKKKKKKLCSSAQSCYSCENHRSQRHVVANFWEVFFAFSKSFGRKRRKKRFLFHRCERERERRDDDVSSSSSEEKFCRWRKRRKEDE